MVELVLSGSQTLLLVYTSTERDRVWSRKLVSCNAWNVYSYVMNWICVAFIKLLKQPKSCLCMHPHALCIN